MGFPVAYSQLVLPVLLFRILTLLVYIRRFIFSFFLYLGLPDLLEPDIPPPDAADADVSASTSPATDHRDTPLWALLFKDLLPVVKFSDLVDPPGSCAVCFYDFEGEDEIRRLVNCRHVFHRSCLDRWMGYDQRTCPLCRTILVPDDMQETFNETFWAASIHEFYGGDSQIQAL